MIAQRIRERLRPAFDAYDPDYWPYHIAIVHRYAMLLVDKLGAEKEVVELAVFLHDYGRVRFPERGEEHHLTGAELAEELLSELGASRELISHVQACIRTHRGANDLRPESLEAEILANADALAHFDALPYFFRIRFSKGEGLHEAAAWIRRKLERNWTKKLSLPEAKELARPKYEAARILLDAALAVEAQE